MNANAPLEKLGDRDEVPDASSIDRRVRRPATPKFACAGGMGWRIVWLLLISCLMPLAQATSWDDPLNAIPTLLTEGMSIAPMPQICPPDVDLERPVSLMNALDLALCNHPQVKSAWATIKVQAGSLGESKAAYLPTVNAGVSRYYIHDSFSGGINPSSSDKANTTQFNLNLRLFDFGVRSSKQASADSALQAAMYTYDAALQDVILKTIGAYFDVLTTRAVQQASQESAHWAREILDSSLRREQKKVAARNDTVLARTNWLKAELDSQKATGDYNKASAVLRYQIGLSSGRPLILQDPNEDATAITFNDLQSWLEITQQEHPAILAAKKQVEAAVNKANATSKEGWPYLEANVSQNNGNPSQGVQAVLRNTSTVGVTLNFPLFDGFARQYRLAGDLARAEEAQAQLQGRQLQVLGEVVRAHADVVSSFSGLDISDQLLKSAFLGLDSARRRYEKGVVELPDLIASQRALSEAQQSRVRVLAEWRASRLRLRASAGLLYSINQ